MLVLLSSWYRPRYKEDILRCLAAPVGTELQFRYDRKWVAQNVREKSHSADALSNRPVMVCFLDHAQSGLLPIVPVRLGTVSRIREHGSTMTVSFRLGDFVYADPARIAEQVHTLSGKLSPVNENNSINGSYVFELASDPGSLERGLTVGLWEKIVTSLSSHVAFQSEPFFWGILDVHVAGALDSTEVFRPLPANLPDHRYIDLIIYHFHPKNDPTSRSSLVVSAGHSLELISPPDIAIDSRYDLKTFRLKATSELAGNSPTWIRVTSAAGWNLDIPLSIMGNRSKMLLWTLVAGLMIALSSIMHSLEHLSTPIQVLGSIAFGLLAAAIVVFKLPRVEGI